MRRYFTETIIDWRIFDAFLGKHLPQAAVTTPPAGHFQQEPVFDVDQKCALRL
jgi:hypothetical protein